MLKSILLTLGFIFISQFHYSQQMTGSELLDKTIEYHDPNDNWKTFSGELTIQLETPNNETRTTFIEINLPQEYFYSQAKRAENITEFLIKKDSCVITFNGKKEFTQEEINKYGLTCERAKMYQNYYTYLYGLPMKLKDPGTNIKPEITRKVLKGKEYFVLEVTYEEGIGNDIWFFYINPKTYAMEVYQFYHTKNDSSQIDYDTGEYILLSGEKRIYGVNMPKERAWFTNKDNRLLGIDVLQ